MISFLLLLFAFAVSETVPVITVADSINPGTSDYIMSNIEAAEKKKSPFLILELDTPGGLVDTTRILIQRMLASPIPIVIFVSPKGAHAGSAGALITLASDIAVMAPATNIGAAHPVAAGGEQMDKVMSQKMAEDLAAYAESLADLKGRNAEWAKKAVTKSSSIAAEKAKEMQVIDLIVEDLPALLKKLENYSLRKSKRGVTQLPAGPFSIERIPPTLRQKVISFFANPNIAYLMMSAAGICLWIELTHPGLVVPGVLGVLCGILSLISFQMLPIHTGALLLVLAGLIGLFLEILLPTHGILGVGGVISFVVGSLYLMNTDLSDLQISLSLILPVALALGGICIAITYLVVRSRKLKSTSGTHAFIGELAVVQELVTPTAGKVLIQGEIWEGRSQEGRQILKGETVRVTAVQNMVLIVDKV